MARRATAEDIQRFGILEFEVPELLDAEGVPLTLKIRKVHGGERLALMPGIPGSVFKGPPEELEARERAWLDTLSPEALEIRRKESLEYPYRLIAHATVEPVLTVEDCRPLGNTAWLIADRITTFSDNGRPKPGQGTATDEVPPAAMA